MPKNLVIAPESQPYAQAVRFVPIDVKPHQTHVNPNRQSRIITILGVGITALIILLACQSWSYFRLYLESAFAEEQTRTFDELRALALGTNAATAAAALRHVFIYYPSGSKQRTGSLLDRTVERHRLAVARHIIAYLRLSTGQDLGDTPDPWIERFAKPD